MYILDMPIRLFKAGVRTQSELIHESLLFFSFLPFLHLRLVVKSWHSTMQEIITFDVGPGSFPYITIPVKG